MMSYARSSRRLARVLLVAALFILPLTAAAAPADETGPSWGSAWESVVDEVLGWFDFAPSVSPDDAPSRVHAASGLGSESGLGGPQDDGGRQSTSSEPIEQNKGPKYGPTLDPDS